MIAALLFCLVLSASAALPDIVRYDGYQILEVTLANEAEREAINVLTSYPYSQVTWNSDSESCNREDVCDLMVGPKSAPVFAASAKVFQNVKVVVEDLQAVFDANKQLEKEHPYVSYKESANEFFEAYRDYDEIIDYFNGLIAEFPNLISRVDNIGLSYQGQPIWAVVIHNKDRPVQSGVFWNGLQHCREWIAGHSLIFTADALLRRYGTDPNITSIVDNMEIHIVPVFNPDGYVHTRTVDSNWRKNRQPNTGSTCIGTDLNRNWVYEWSLIGSSNNPCSDTFHGAGPNSGPETRAIDNYIRNRPAIQGYIDWHSSGNLWMLPWGCYSYDIDDIDTLMATGQRAANAIRTYRGTVFRVGPIYEIIYPVSGSSCDTTYADSEMNRLQSYALEIGTSFQPNAREIVPTGEEMLRGAIVHCQDTLIGAYNNNKLAEQK